MSGVDTAIEAVGAAGSPAGRGRRRARGDCRRGGVHRAEGDLHRERWSRTSRSSRVWWTVVQFRKLDPARLMTDRFRFDQILDAYDAFARAPAMRALEAPTEFN